VDAINGSAGEIPIEDERESSEVSKDASDASGSVEEARVAGVEGGEESGERSITWEWWCTQFSFHLMTMPSHVEAWAQTPPSKSLRHWFTCSLQFR
jgi:hypothetical protein